MHARYRFNRVATPADDAEQGEIEHRTEGGTDYLVMPVVASREQVYEYRTNAGTSVAEYLPADELEAAVPDGGAEYPAVIDHPVNDAGEFVPVDSPDATNVTEVGEFRDLRANESDDGRSVMTGEVWIPEQNVGSYGGALSAVVDRVQEGDPVEVSIGYDPDVVNQAGRFNGTQYDRVQKNIDLDHLAILPHEEGNCSVENGCGLGRDTQALTANTALGEDDSLSARVRAELRTILGVEPAGTGNITALRSNTQIGADSGSCGCGGEDPDSCECDGHGGADESGGHHANATPDDSNGDGETDGESDSSDESDAQADADSHTDEDDEDTMSNDYDTLAERTPYSADELRDMDDDRVQFIEQGAQALEGDGDEDDDADESGDDGGEQATPEQGDVPADVVTSDEFETVRETVESLQSTVESALVEPQEEEKEQAAETITANTSVSKETVMQMDVDEAKALARDVGDDDATGGDLPPNMAAAPSQDGAVRANSAQSGEDPSDYPAPGKSNWEAQNGDD